MPLTCYDNLLLTKICNGSIPLKIASRPSPLAILQVEEILNLLKQWYPLIQSTIIKVPSQGDRDKVTRLDLMDKTDFFTKTIDELVIQNTCDIAVHSAKDLPHQLSIPIAGLTKGLDSSDVFVFQEKYLSQSFPQQLIIGCSSTRRSEYIKRLFPYCTILPLRGTVDERLNQLNQGFFDGIIVAKAALIRLNQSLHNTLELPYSYHPLQGKLAITARNAKLWYLFLQPICDPKFIPDYSLTNRLEETFILHSVNILK